MERSLRQRDQLGVPGEMTYPANGDEPEALEGVDEHQPSPIKSARPAIQDLVIADIQARKAVGLKRYGTLLQPFNGRDALMDAYQEALDLAQYLRQAIEERNETARARAANAAPSAD